jgi:hypothetical protein
MFQEVVFGESIVIGSGDHVPLLVAMDYKRATGHDYPFGIFKLFLQFMKQ